MNARDTMTPRERWTAVLRREKPDRVPMDYWGTPETGENLRRHLGCSTDLEVYERLHIDKAIHLTPAYVGPEPPADTDIFGRRFEIIHYKTGSYKECVHHPLADYESVEEIERNYTWPSVDWWDYSEIPAQARQWERYPLVGGGSEPLLIYKELRGQEQAYIDMIEYPEIVHYCLDRLFGLAYENTRRIYEQVPGQVFYSYVAEDMGSQEGLMFSKQHIHEFLLPRMKRMIELAQGAGVYAFHHSDGGIREILPDMIELGIDVLNPIQWRCRGMERKALKADFGDAVIFHGGVDNQYTLAFGSVDEVVQETRDNLRILGNGGGYILAPCHNIQPVSPPENIVAMYETGYNEGRT